MVCVMSAKRSLIKIVNKRVSRVSRRLQGAPAEGQFIQLFGDDDDQGVENIEKEEEEEKESYSSAKEEEFDNHSVNSSGTDSVFGGPSGEIIKMPDRVKVPNSVVDPGTFSGLSTENVCHYLRHFETVARASDWDGGRKCKYLPCFLRGAARSWYENFITYTTEADLTWEILSAALLSNFNSQSFKELAIAKLGMRFQGDTEAFESYFYDVLNFCTTIDPVMNEESKVRYILRGMRPTLVEKIYPLGCKTTAEVLQHAVAQEAARYAVAQRTLMATLFQPNVLGSSSFGSVIPGALFNTGVAPHVPTAPAPPVVVSTPLAIKAEPIAAISSSDTNELLKELVKEIKSLRMENGGRQQEQRGGYSDSYRGGGDYKGPPSRSWDGKPRCFRCNRMGHIAMNCYTNNSNNNNGNQFRGRGRGRGSYRGNYNSGGGSAEGNHQEN